MAYTGRHANNLYLDFQNQLRYKTNLLNRELLILTCVSKR